jgi:hypothetical protein
MFVLFFNIEVRNKKASTREALLICLVGTAGFEPATTTPPV